MIKYNQWHYKFSTFRMSQFKEIWNISDIPELPFGSILHVLDNFQMNSPVELTPHMNNPIINLNKFKLFVHNITGPQLPSDTDLIETDVSKMIYVNSGLMTSLANYKREMMPRVMYYNDINELPFRPSTQAVVNYNPLFRARVVGIRRRIRLSNFILSTLINTIAKRPNEHHYIHIPLENIRFEKKDFIRAFKEFSRITVIYPEIMQYIFFCHFYAILAKKIDFKPRPKDEEVDLSEEGLTPELASLEGYDPELTSEDFMINLRNSMLEDPLYAMEALQSEYNFEVSIFEKLPPDLFSKINFIFTAGNKCVTYNLRDIKDLNGAANTGMLRIIAQLNNLVQYADKAPIVNETPIAPEKIITVDETTETPNAPQYNKPLTEAEHKAAAEEDVKELDEDADKVIEETPDITPAQKERAKTISKTYKSLTIKGKSLDKVLTEPVGATKLEDNSVTPEKNAGISKTATASTIEALDRTYVKHAMDHDIAAILTSFNKQGMFLVDLKEEEHIDELNELKTYVASYEDVRHKNHRIKFTIPKVDEMGRAKINGSLKCFTKQRVSNPICKVSATRVTLNSNMNKAIVERNQNVANDFMSWFIKALDKMRNEGIQVTTKFGSIQYPIIPLPFEYTQIGSKYEFVEYNDFTLFSDYNNRFISCNQDYVDIIKSSEKLHGVWIGQKDTLDSNMSIFMKADGLVTVINYPSGKEEFCGAFIDFMEWSSGVKMNSVDEFIELKLLNKSIPIIFALAYRFGLSNMLQYCGVDYEIQDIGTRSDKVTSDLVIKFSDKRLVIRRVPRFNSLLFGGLNQFDLSDVLLEDMDEKDVYYDMLQQKKLSINNIKGIDDFFDMFIDNMTRDALREMHQPTNTKDLLLSAVRMLTTSDHEDAASRSNFRFRGVEQITGIVYNELVRAFGTYKHKSIGATNKFSVSEYTIKQRIMEEQLMENVNILNPIDDIKQYSKFSNAGSGGRSNETFKVADRQFTKDSLGVVSEATVDNGKTGLNATLPFNPILTNVRGMAAKIDYDKLEPENMLSLNTLLMPCVTQDDGKRTNFSSIQASAVVPIANAEVSRTRTGYEGVVAHRTRPPFAYAAQEDGIVTFVDEKLKVVKIKYKSGEEVCLNYGDQYTNNCSNGFYVDQKIALNGFKQGDKFKKDDIITYNEQFFQNDPYSKQVNWKIGVLVNCALLDNGGTIEDADIFTQPLCDKMGFSPIHVKEITLTINTNVHKFAFVGAHVNSTDPLMIFDESAVPDSMQGEDIDEELAALLADLNKATPKAGHTGDIVQIDALYKTEIKNMSKSLQTIVNKVVEEKDKRSKLAEASSNRKDFPPAAPLYATDKIGTTELTEETIIFRFYIKQNKGLRCGDKVFLDSSLKATVSTVYDESIATEDPNFKVDMCSSSRGILARLITSPFLSGLSNAILEKCEQDILDMWYN